MFIFELHFYKRRHKVKKDDHFGEDHGEGSVTVMAGERLPRKGTCAFLSLASPAPSHRAALFSYLEHCPETGTSGN